MLTALMAGVEGLAIAAVVLGAMDPSMEVEGRVVVEDPLTWR